MRNNIITPNSEALFGSEDYARFFDRKCEGGGIFHTYNNIISVENLLASWREFSRDKKKRKDVVLFSVNLMDNIYSLHNELKNKKYAHSKYEAFKINDPKPRDIHKAVVRDRLLHHGIYRILYPFFDRKFIYDSYSCRLNKGTHKAMQRFESFTRKVSKNHTKTCWILKCDIRKFFANIDHQILKNILARHIQDKDILWLLENVINSFEKGLPLGNLTSQLLVNIYMNEFDQYVKHKLKVKYYIRYADDFVVLNDSKEYLENILKQMSDFLENKLKLYLHPDKVFIKTIYSGIDFLGWVHFPKHRVLRTATKKRMFRRLKENPKEETKQSYLGMLRHGDGYGLQVQITCIDIVIT
ncbi:RNA-dependent DNA polymerase [Candidatus Nomurabacteria bacterium]|nr:RNA-dependent DNA polymerase [Candidatus Nomurabacteria bacterium]